MFTTGLRSLQRWFAKQPSDLVDARRIAAPSMSRAAKAWSPPMRSSVLRDYLDQKHADEWENDLTGVYLAGSLETLHKETRDAEALIG